MSTLADSWRELAYSIRSLPAEFGLRQYSTSIVIETWSGNHVGDGSCFEKVTPILENGGTNPKLRFMNEEQRTLAGLEVGSCEVGPITPDFGSNGTPLSDLLPSVKSHEVVYALVTGPRFPNGAKFAIKKLETDRALHWTMSLEPISLGIS